MGEQERERERNELIGRKMVQEEKGQKGGDYMGL
jgi:hypothetical protein